MKGVLNINLYFQYCEELLIVKVKKYKERKKEKEREVVGKLRIEVRASLKLVD